MKIINQIIIALFPYSTLWFAFVAFRNGILWITVIMGIISLVAWLVVAGDIMKKEIDGRNN